MEQTFHHVLPLKQTKKTKVRLIVFVIVLLLFLSLRYNRLSLLSAMTFQVLAKRHRAAGVEIYYTWKT